MSLSKDDLVDALRQASRAGYLGGLGGGGSNPSPGSSSSSGSNAFTKELSAAGGAVKGLGEAAIGVGSKLAEGGARMSDATEALSRGFGGLGASGSVLGTALDKGSKGLAALGQNIDQNIDTWRKLSDTGLSFGNDIMAMKDQASAARLSIAEMSEVLQKNNASMLGFGATSAESAKKLSKMSNEFFTSGLGEELRGMGYTTKELNEVLAVSISGSKLKDLKDKDGQDRSLKAAASLATEMDAVAKITGQSKQDQLDELRRKATDGQRMAAIDEAIAKGGEGAKEAFDAISTNGKLMGPQFQKLAEDMASMGRPSEGMEQAYGLLSSGAKKLMSEAGDAARSGNRERAAELTKQAAAEQAAFQQTSQYRTMAAQAGIKETQESYAQGAKFRNALEQAGKELGPMAGSSEKTALALKKLDEQVKAEQQAGGDKDPNAAAGASITRFAVDVESRGRDLTKVLNDQVIQPLAKDVAPQIVKLSKDLKLGSSTAVADQLGKPMAAGYDKARLSRIVNEEAGDKSSPDKGVGAKKDAAAKDVIAFNQLINGSQKQSDTALKVIEKIANEKSMSKEDVVKGAMANKGAGMADLVSQIKKELPASEQPGAKDAQKTELEKRTGKLQSPGNEPSALESVGKGVDALGGLFRSASTAGFVTVTNLGAHAVGGIVSKPEISLVGEAGPEAIFNKGQLEDYTAKIMGSAAGAMPKFDIPKFDLSGMSKSISTSISSVSRGKESTSQLSTDDLADLKKPFKQAFADISSGFNELITDSSSIVKENSEKIKADISDALPVKEVAAQQQEFKSQFTESQQKIIDDYKGYSEENRSFHAQAMKSGIKEDTETAQMIGARIAKMKAEIGDRQATKEEEAALENETLNKAMFERQVEKKKEMLDVMQNLGDYSAKREQELKEKAAKDAIAITAAIEDKKTDAIKSDIKEALPVDAEFGDLDGAIARNKADDEAKSELARESRRGAPVIEDRQEGKLIDTPKSKMMSATDMLAGGLSFGANGMPIMKSIDAAKKSIEPAKKSDTSSDDAETAKLKRQQDAKKEEESKKSDSKAATKEATLSDVVTALNTLNKQMGQLIAVNEDGHKSTTKAARSGASNIYAR